MFNFKRIGTETKMRFSIEDQDAAVGILWLLMGYIAWSLDVFSYFAMMLMFYCSTTPLWSKYWKNVRKVRNNFLDKIYLLYIHTSIQKYLL